MDMAQIQTKLMVQVQPNARRNEIVGFDEDILRIKISAPPVKGKANKALIEFLGQVLGIRKRDITVARGETNKRKIVMIDGLSQTQLIQKLKNR